MLLRLLSALPFIGMLGGIVFVNRVTPLILGMPLVLAWVVLWSMLCSVTMGIVYLCDPANRTTRPAAGRQGEADSVPRAG